MTTAELVNLIIAKFGGNRVQFVDIQTVHDEWIIVTFYHSDQTYYARCSCNEVNLTVHQEFGQTSQYSEWIEGVLNGMVRNDAGELVKR